ncbi:hypothetical protein CesoFtcFv8_024557 [Champsocephalus esox]|uniref:Uncharacterized protein n=2 Tax=Champsocephalus TaxID=52236 RepID=A0AAN8CCG3_CHAGU|nr:hypothetical protein CesoFtcFv8_024557 [Champsocephalus esox]KAK5901184.1 hypothetical protein CgunFtcFv8_026080 [Champsocephalus gunnari]
MHPTHRRPDVLRHTQTERTKQAKDNRHQLHEHSAAQKRLKSRSSFLDPTEVLETTPSPDARTSEWQNQWNSLGSHTPQTNDSLLATTNLGLSGKQ